MKIEELIARVAGKTQGTSGDPLTLDEVGQIVRATIKVLQDEGELVEPKQADD